MKVRITKVAQDDLTRIGDWIAETNPARASSFVAEIVEKALGLAEMPRRFPLVRGIEATGIRSRVHGEYLIFYHVLEDAVEVLHVLHGARRYLDVLSSDFPDA